MQRIKTLPRSKLLPLSKNYENSVKSYDQKHDFSVILVAILNLDNLYEQKRKNCTGNTFDTNRLVII